MARHRDANAWMWNYYIGVFEFYLVMKRLGLTSLTLELEQENRFLSKGRFVFTQRHEERKRILNGGK